MRVSIGDCRLFVDVEGMGLVPDGRTMRQRPTLIALHGGPGLDHSSFKPDFGVLADVAQILYIDHRGQGRSEGRDQHDTWHLAQWAADIVSLCDVLGITEPIVYGVSFGGMVALQYAIDHPGHAAKVILDSTAATTDVDTMVEVFGRLGGDEAASIAREFWTTHVSPELFGRYVTTCMPLYNRHASPDPDRSARGFETGNFELFQEWSAGEQRTFDLLGSLDRIACPVLLLSGEDDPVTPLAGARRLAEGIGPELCRFETFADCGHGVWRDQPDAAFAVLRDFINR